MIKSLQKSISAGGFAIEIYPSAILANERLKILLLKPAHMDPKLTKYCVEEILKFSGFAPCNVLIRCKIFFI